MNAAFHFTSAQKITPEIIYVIRHAYYIREYDPFVPEWQIQEVRRRDAITGNNSVCFLDGDKVIRGLGNELKTV